MSKSAKVPLSVIAKEKSSKTARQLWQITKAFFQSERRGRARTLLILLLLLSVAYVGVTVLTSYAGRDLMTAIEQRNHPAYWLIGVGIDPMVGAFVAV
jgi:ABC-type uncharacterized transport system fused permease/ATPase subunit